jgi:hypothetical protein
MATTIICDCGATVVHKHPGQRLHCPRCGALLVYGDSSDEPEPAAKTTAPKPEEVVDTASRSATRSGRGAFVASGGKLVDITIGGPQRRRKKRRPRPPPVSEFAVPQWHRWADPVALFWSVVLAPPLAVVSEMILFSIRFVGLAGDWLPGPFLLTGMLFDFPLRELGYAVMIVGAIPFTVAMAFALQHATETLLAASLNTVVDSAWTSEIWDMALTLWRWVMCVTATAVLVVPIAWLIAYWAESADPRLRTAALVLVAFFGMLYFLITLLAVTLHDDFRAANPITTLAAMPPLARDLAKLTMELVIHLAGYGFWYWLQRRLCQANWNGTAFLIWILTWAFFVMSMTRIMRRLGEIYATNATRLDWFRVRPEPDSLNAMPANR